MSSSRQTLTPLLERRQLEITKLRAEVTALKAEAAQVEPLKARVAELEALLMATKGKR
jgi:hypothetical protein